MVAPSIPQIPAPIPYPSFLRASHFQLGYDSRPEGKTVVSPYRTDYPPRWGTFCPPPVQPPRSAEVLNQDLDPTWDAHTETGTSYPPWPLQPRPQICPPVSRCWMHIDPRQSFLDSVTHSSYGYDSGQTPTALRRGDKWGDSVPSGDKAKQPLPETLHQQSYQPPPKAAPPAKAPSQHLGEDAVLKGDSRHYYDTSYKSQYTGELGPPAQRCKEKVGSVPFGDPRCHETESEQKRAYTPWPLHGQCYDPKMAAAKVFQTNICPGDGRRRFSTIMSESYPWKESGPLCISRPGKNYSSILLGSCDARRNQENITNHRFYYQEPKAMDLVHPLAHEPMKCRATLCLGDNRLPPSFSTTQHSDYQVPPDEIRKVESKKMDLLKSSIPFNDHTALPTTTTQDMLVTHRLQKHQLTEEDLQRIKYSHLVHPWQDLRWFSTEHKDKFTNKYSGPIRLATGDFQKSSVPLGTMPKYQHRPKISS